jgi:hypothetical protein
MSDETQRKNLGRFSFREVVEGDKNLTYIFRNSSEAQQVGTILSIEKKLPSDGVRQEEKVDFVFSYLECRVIIAPREEKGEYALNIYNLDRNTRLFCATCLSNLLR